MFQIKHIIRLSFVCMFLTILGSILFYRYFTITNIVMLEITKNNFKIVEAYNEKIWSKQLNNVNLLKNNSLQDAIKNVNFLKFTNDSMEFLQEINAPKVELYDILGNKFLSTTNAEFQNIASANLIDFLNNQLDSFFLGKYNFSKGIQSAYNGIVSHQILTHVTLDANSTSSPHVFIESYIPLNNTAGIHSSVTGVMRIIVDVTDYWLKIKYFEKRVLIILLFVFTIFFIIILFNTHNAQQIIDQQVANNRSLEEAKIQAEIENTAKTEFLANVSHELRTPLNAIIGFSEIIISEAYGKLEHTQYSEYIHDINNSGRHLLSVINDILDFSKASADKLKVDNIEIDITKLASASLRFVTPRANEAKVILVEEVPKEPIVIKADAKRLKQALLNMLSNAVKFTPEGGTVTLSLHKNNIEKVVYIRVADTGIGMAEKDLPKVLSGFYQIDNKLSRRYEGTGLGLPLTKKLIELMGGRFEITSKLGIGTIVNLIFEYEEHIEI